MKRRSSLKSKSTLNRMTPLRSDVDTARKFARRRPISPASPEQRQKVREALCVNCGQPGCDPAHLTPRSLGGCDSPLCVVPLCRTCHGGLDHRRGPQADIDLAPLVALPDFAAERAHMATHLSYPAALQRLTGQRWAPLETAA